VRQSEEMNVIFLGRRGADSRVCRAGTLLGARRLSGCRLTDKRRHDWLARLPARQTRVFAPRLPSGRTGRVSGPEPGRAVRPGH